MLHCRFLNLTVYPSETGIYVIWELDISLGELDIYAVETIGLSITFQTCKKQIGFEIDFEICLTCITDVRQPFNFAFQVQISLAFSGDCAKSIVVVHHSCFIHLHGAARIPRNIFGLHLAKGVLYNS